MGRTVSRANGRGVRALRLLYIGGLTALVGWLVAFHALLLWRRLVGRSLLEPGAALRWLAAILVIAGLLRLHRSGVSLLRGRHALACWLVALLIHAGLPVGVPGQVAAGVPDPALLAALPVVLSVAATLAPLLRRLGGLPAGALVASRPSGRWLEPAVPFVLSSGLTPDLYSRPPPA